MSRRQAQRILAQRRRYRRACEAIGGTPGTLPAQTLRAAYRLYPDYKLSNEDFRRMLAEIDAALEPFG